MAESRDNFSTLLLAFANQVDLVWYQYEASGPGNVDSALIEPIARLARQLTETYIGSTKRLPGRGNEYLLNGANPLSSSKYR